ncbi:MAG: type I-C CRISPR-associated endonuclease Cas1 [Acidobacteria bacterium]|nr:type I-C CRISPR-associated endonuclease Cas1 [Acidobacteriota bacterium]
MRQHLNTLFVTTQGAYLRKEGDALAVQVERKTVLRVPLHHLGGICCFGNVGVSPRLLGRCAETGIAVTYLSERGRFLARVSGCTPGNVLLRREQYRRADRVDESCLELARPMVLAKILNSRTVLQRAVRDVPQCAGDGDVGRAIRSLAASALSARHVADLDGLRGVEGDAGRTYFSVFRLLISRPGDFEFRGRSRRPPRDNVNAALSFVYTLLMHDARAALEAAGLDSQVGFLHRDRPGRPSLALDLMEEFRTFLADRLVLSLINREQISAEGFVETPVGGVVMNDSTRKQVIAAYQKRKLEELLHPFLAEQVTIGHLIYVQALLLARHLRGDLDAYPSFLWR